MMVRIDWYFDVISPYAYLAFEQLPSTLSRITKPVVIHYRPVLFAGLLDHFGQKGPAEIPSKRRFTYEHVLWLAHRFGVAVRTPRHHPFNPLPLLRAILAAGGTDGVTREHVAQAFHYVWQQGHLPDEPEFAALLSRLNIRANALAADGVKAQLRANTDAAIADEVFGVPTAVVRIDKTPARRFWGFDALPMMVDFIENNALFGSEAMQRAGNLPVGTQRKAAQA
jgi:2-hydroxychromene-2-carboxylate isomerase